MMKNTNNNVNNPLHYQNYQIILKPDSFIPYTCFQNKVNQPISLPLLTSDLNTVR